MNPTKSHLILCRMLVFISLIASVITISIGQEDDLKNIQTSELFSRGNSKLISLPTPAERLNKNNKEYIVHPTPTELQQSLEESQLRLTSKFEQKNESVTEKDMKKTSKSETISGPVKKIFLFTCATDDKRMQQVCYAFCTQKKDFDMGACSTDQQTCVCSMKNDHMTPSFKVKLFKPSKQPVNKNTMLQQTNVNRVVSKGYFECNGSDDAKAICSAYCENTKRVQKSGCSVDGKTCLCYSSTVSHQPQNTIVVELNDSKVERSGRSSNIIEAEETFAGMGAPIPIQARKRRPMARPPLRGCNSISCMAYCPPTCQSMCMYSVECFCSCNDDLFYEYEEYDYSFFG